MRIPELTPTKPTPPATQRTVGGRGAGGRWALQLGLHWGPTTRHSQTTTSAAHILSSTSQQKSEFHFHEDRRLLQITLWTRAGGERNQY